MESGRQNLDNDETKQSSRPSSVVPTYKSETDETNLVSFDQQLKSNELLNMGKQNGGESDLDDGTKERMLTDESTISPTKDATEVKFISENGDAKIDIETPKQTLSGMGKEELMKFANDPFWVRLRWFLFISFWVLWVSMLAGAIAIIIVAPKCVSPKPKQWWEESPIVKLQFSDSPTKDLKGFKSLLNELKEQHIKAISLPPIMKGSLQGYTDNFMELDPQLGDLNDLEDLIKAAKERDQHLILELDPNYSSMNHSWFEQSVIKKDPYTDYYIWADGKTTPDGRRQPPNNWLSVNGGSAWEWNEQRGQYYLHQFKKAQPDLNFSSPTVIAEFGNILKYWLKLGISGFRLANTQYLTEDPSLRDESLSSIPTEVDNYQSLIHVYTRDRPENAEVLTKWQEIVYNETKGQGLFALQNDIGADILEVYNEKKTLISLPQSSQFLTTANASINATTLNKGISQWISISSWPGWDLNGEQYSLRQRMAPDIADSITLMSMLLPGTPILRLNDTLSAKNAFSILAKARTSATFLYGETDTRVVNGTVFVYTRLKSGNPGYLVAYQSEEYPKIIDISSIPGIPEEVTMLACSPNYPLEEVLNIKLPSNMIPILPKSTLILTFVPKDDNN
ncbi:PREDICTED: neutral and basic amino acid transport protein rBAT isoform X2 [Polistes canadensis]|uniref:neutral and basic amino acid transport protein rBAT isoform X2 n=1 Tax=Polistes canadensis TaxID=91411 RepID=UPI000718C44D|nr:PREDICTED: neutral and basic amino acid transport protein rBAT isoform X2 [Polistes canadensis]